MKTITRDQAINEELPIIIDNVDYSYPSCGGVIVRRIDDDTISVERQDNRIGYLTGNVFVYSGFLKISNRLDEKYTELDTCRDLIGKRGIGYIDELVMIANFKGRFVE